MARPSTTAPVVGIIMGSQSDWETMVNAADTLKKLGVAFEAEVVSAHRTPHLAFEWCTSAEARGLKVIIAAAGGDGTVNEVLNGIGDAPDGFERACLGVLPVGTVNVFARELGIPCVNGIANAVELLEDGQVVTIDGYLGIVTVGAPEFDLEKG